MLKLQKIQILGFKSFADKSELVFKGDGITAIVGPNGCGKSNISDAVAWVLGEQSPKMLRGGRMEDVIFNGTRDRLPLGLAEVSLTFVDPEFLREASFQPPLPATEPGIGNGNGEKALDELSSEAAEASDPVEAEPVTGSETVTLPEGGTAVAVRRKRRPKFQPAPGELVVTRRLFRSGDSEYLINGRQMRLRDIQDIFMGTGLGPDSYAIIEQGRVGLILSSKPSDRRSIIEEAAGITKFKSKRKLAESKLEQARQNLLRINDITEEVSKQLGSLKRQASKARRYGELRDKMRGLSKKLFTARETSLLSLLSATQQQLATACELYQRKHQDIQDQETLYRQRNSSIFDVEERLKHLREQLSQTNLEMDRAQQRVQFHQEQLRQLDARATENSQEIERLRQHEELLSGELAQKRQALEEAAARFEQINSEYLAQNSTSQNLQVQIRELESSEESCRARLLDCVGSAAALRNQLSQMDELERRLEQQIARLQIEQADASTAQEKLTGEHRSVEQQCREQKQRLEQLQDQTAGHAQRLAGFKEQEAITAHELADKKEQLSGSSHRLQSLEELVAHHAYSTEAVRLLLSAAREAASHGFQSAGILADLVEVESPHEAIVEEFLKHELEFLLVETPSAAEQGITLLRKEGAGKSTFLFCRQERKLDSSGLDPLVSELSGLDSSLVPLRDVVRFPETIRTAVEEALPHLYSALIVPTYQRALDLAQQYPQLIFLTADGETIRGRLISGGGKTTGGHLSLKKEIRELTRREQALQKAIALQDEQVQVLRQSINSEESELGDARQKTQDLEKTQVASDLRLRQLKDDLDRVARRENLASLELQRIEEEKNQIQTNRSAHLEEIAAAESSKAEIEGRIAALQAESKQLKNQASQDSQTLSELRSDLATFRERKLAAETELDRLASNLRDCQERVFRLDSQKNAWVQQKQELENSIRDTQEQLFKQAVEKASLEAGIRSKEDELAATRNQQASLELELQAVRNQMEDVQNQKTRLEIDRARLNSDVTHLEETCFKELGSTLAEIRPESAVELSTEDLQQLEGEYQELRGRIEGLGPVNMMALEEYQECEQRFQFLSAQRQDLLDSIEDTTTAIKEIDQVSREQFREAFKAINENFQESFKSLFGGGHGEMKLMDEMDELDSGIEIIAQPPGKRLQNVLLLSGGEKALTAIALLLAIFKYQPSPFCVLDEVDAPLDEINVGRFSQMIKLMSAGTQFVVITHSRRTMEAADTLYGVTMQEAGVSKLVSVHFD